MKDKMDKDQSEIYVSVVIPVYNEAENIPRLNSSLMAVLHKMGKPFEIIYVDDCSSDETFTLIKKICSQHETIRAVRLRRNFGQSAAMSAGFDIARGKTIVAMDGDMQNDPADIPALLSKLEEGYDVVNGWRKDRKDRLLSRRIPSIIENWIIVRTTGVRLHVYGCSLKAYKSEVIKNVPLYGGLHRFIPALASIYGARITEMTVNHHARLYGKSKYTLSRAFRVLIDLISVIFLKFFLDRPLHIFGWSGILLLMAGTVIDGYLAFQKIFYGASLSNRPLLLFGTLLILAGLQLFSMGILAEIQVRTYYESQGKPIYSVRERINIEKNE